MSNIASRVCLALIPLAFLAGCAEIDDELLDNTEAESADSSVGEASQAIKAPVGKRACYDKYNNYSGMATVTAEPSLTVRNRPSTSGKPINSVKEKARVYVNHCSAGWAYITIDPGLPTPNSPKGWVSGEYLRVN